MRGYDLTPLFRTSVGFDQLFSLLDHTMKLDEAACGYPPYNIEKTGHDQYRITMAVAGFGQSDLSIVAENATLTVTGRKQEPENAPDKNFLHRGIASRAFERRFQLADHVRVENASLADGLLHIELKRDVPEKLRPRAIPIAINGTSKTVEAKTH